MRKIKGLIVVAVILLICVGIYWYLDTSGAIGFLLSKAGMDQYVKGNHESAIKLIELSLEKDTVFDQAMLYNSLAECYAMTGDVDKAIELYKTSIELNNAYITSYINLAATYLVIKNDPANAEIWLNKAKEIDSQNPVLRETFGHLYLRKNEPEKAIAEFEAALTEAPEPTIYGAISEAYAMMGDIDNAKKYLKQAEQSGLAENALNYYTSRIDQFRE